MRVDIIPGAVFPDYELSDHKGKHRKLSALQQQMAQKLSSEETAQQLNKHRHRMFLDLMKTPESELAHNLERGPHAAIDAMVPAIVMHNLAREEFRTALREEFPALHELLLAPTCEVTAVGRYGHIGTNIDMLTNYREYYWHERDR